MDRSKSVSYTHLDVYKRQSLNESKPSITIKKNEDRKQEDLKSEKNSAQPVENASTVDVNASVEKVSKVTSAVSATKEILSFEEVNHYPYSLTSKNYLWIDDQEKMDEIFRLFINRAAD